MSPVQRVRNKVATRNTEPALLAGAIGAVIVVILSAFGIVLDPNVAEAAVAALIPIVVAIVTRQSVVPLAKLRKQNV